MHEEHRLENIKAESLFTTLRETFWYQAKWVEMTKTPPFSSYFVCIRWHGEFGLGAIKKLQRTTVFSIVQI